MSMISRNQITERAEAFVWHAARLLERLRFEQLFRGGDAERVAHALASYQSRDGGFGQALEPDFRGPISQPVTVLFALQVLDELERFDGPMLERALDYLSSVSAADGGLPFVLDSAVAYPRAPWWQPDPAQPGCLVPTASIAGLLHKHAVDHPLRARLTEFSWAALEALPSRTKQLGSRLAALQVAYDSRAALVFLEYAPERARASHSAELLGRALRDADLIRLGDVAPGEAMSPLDFAPHPSSPARAWFDDASIERELAALRAEQREDGGFTFAWQVWTPVTELEWRGVQTVEKLKTLRAYGCLTQDD